MLRGKTALVTGSTSGVGLGIARGLAGAGCRIVLNGFGGSDEIEILRAGLAREFDVDVRYDSADIRKSEEIEAMIKRIHEQLGGLDILVNTACAQLGAPVDDFSLDKWNAIIAINLSAAFHTTSVALPRMKTKRWGRIINVAAAHSPVANPYKSAYVAAKRGVVDFTKTAAMEVVEQGITINAICPGPMTAPPAEQQMAAVKVRDFNEEKVKRNGQLAALPTKQVATVEQVTALSLFLAGDAAAWITGAIIPI